LRERAVLDDLHAVADRARVALVVRHELRVASHVLLVTRVLDQALDAHDDGLVHLVADDLADQGPPVSALHHDWAPRIWVSSVSTRATSRRSCWSFAVFSSCPVARFTRALKSSSRSSRDFAWSSGSERVRSSLAFTTPPRARRSGSRSGACAPRGGAPP